MSQKRASLLSQTVKTVALRDASENVVYGGNERSLCQSAVSSICCHYAAPPHARQFRLAPCWPRTERKCLSGATWMKRFQIIVFRVALLAVFLLAPGRLSAADPDALWEIVHGKCVPSEASGSGPAPCSLVDLAEGYAVLKDIRGATQFLLIPTARITGIEDPKLLAQGTPNYWEFAWQARQLMTAPAGRPVPREDVALAVNSVHGRSQNQLHIHIDCLSPEVKRSLARQSGRIGRTWSRLDSHLAGHSYYAIRVEAPDLAGLDAFRLVADGIPSAGAHMGDETIVVAGAMLDDGRPGFYILEDRADLADGDPGSGEELLDHQCLVLKQPD